MNKIYKQILISIMIGFIFAQIFYINKIYQNKEIEVYNNAQSVEYSHKTLTELYEELSCIQEKTILSAKKVSDKWYIKIRIQGDKNKLLSEMEKLKDYNISNYNIKRNKDENAIELEISAKESI